MPLLLLRLTLALAALILAHTVLSKNAPDVHAIGMLLLAAGIARYFAPDMVEIIPAIMRSAKRSALEPWNGLCYSFDNNPIRLCLIDDLVWIVEPDVRPILDPPVSAREQRLLGEGYTRIEALKLHAYSEAAMLRLLELRCASRTVRPRMVKFKTWLEKEALPNVKRLPSSSFV